MKLHVYKGEWGLPSIDFECLQVLCAIKFTEAPVEINLNGNPFLSDTGFLPYLKDDKKKISGYKKILQYLENNGYSINSRLTKNIQFLSDAYNAFIFNHLHPYYYYIIFGDQQNYEKTRALYAKRTPFPFNFYYPGKYQKITDEIIEVFHGFSIHDKKEDHDIDQMILNAKKCINILSIKLGNKKWFFDNKLPSEFDATVYSYLSILYNIQLPTNPLQSHIRECSNLLKFINRITKEYFSKESYDSKTFDNQKSSSSNNTNATILTPSEKEFLENKRKTQIIAFLVAFITMSTYAAWIGLLNVSFGGGQYDDDFIYADEEGQSDQES